MNHRPLIVVAAAVTALHGFVLTAYADGASQENRPLKVLLFPYIPACSKTPSGEDDHSRTAARIKSEASAAGLEVEVTIADPDYLLYGSNTGKLFTDKKFDVVEMDTIVLGETTPYLQSLDGTDTDEWHPAAKSAVSYDGKVWGVPHLLCGYFVFSRDKRIEGVNSADELARLLSGQGAAKDLVGDASGSWDLPAMYLDSWSDSNQGKDASQQVGAALDTNSVEDLATFLGACGKKSANPCFSGGYEPPTMAAVDQFNAGEADALFGYSERAAYVRSKDGEQVFVNAAPLGDGTGGVPLFTDAFVVNKACVGECLTAAKEFIEYMIKPETYDWYLGSRECESTRQPRYLLPAQEAAWKVAATQDPLYRRLKALTATGVSFPNSGFAKWRGDLKESNALRSGIEARLPN